MVDMYTLSRNIPNDTKTNKPEYPICLAEVTETFYMSLYYM